MAGEVLRFTVLGRGDASDLDRLASAVDRITDQIRELDRARANPEIDVNTQKAEKQTGKFAKDFQRTLTRAIESIPEVELDADASDAQREIQAVRAELSELKDQRIGIDLDAGEAQRRVAALKARLETLGDVDLDIQMRADVGSAVSQLAAVNAEVDRLDGRTATVKIKTDGRLGDTVIQVAALGRALGTLAIPAALAAAAPAIAGLGAAAVEASGSVALLPAAAVAGGAAFAALKVGLDGVGAALKKSSDAEAFAAALKKLAPAAADFARKVRDLGPAWKDVKLDVQNRLFRDTAETLGKLSQAYLPAVQSALGGIADGFNRAARESAGFLSNDATVARLAPAFDQIKQAVSNAAGALRPLTEAFVILVETGASRLPKMGQSLADVTGKFRDWLSEAQKSGQLGQWIGRGVDAIKQLGRIAGDVGGILGGIFDAANSAGVGFLDTVERITQGIREFLNSAQGQTTLTNIFTTIRETIDAALPGLQAFALAVLDVINQLSNAGVFQAAGAAISAIAEAAAPVVTQLGNLASAVLPPLLSLVEQLAPALVPLAAGIAGLMIATRVGSAVQGLATKVGDFKTKISGIEGPTGKFKTAVGGLATFLGAGGPWGLAVAGAITAVGLLADAWANSEADAKRQQDAIDALAESLDKYTGKATEATLAQRAQEVGTKTLGDGQTTYATALGKAGVSTRDFVQATTGNAQALQKVRLQLDAATASAIQSSPAYANTADQWDRMGITLEDLAAAAQGNGPAMDKINDAINRSSAGSLEARSQLELYRDSVLGAGGSSAEMGKELNRLAGEFDQASQRAKDAGLASLSFGENLDALKPGLEGLANGGKITQELSDRFVGLSESAGVAAKGAGDAAAALTGVEGGAAAAKKSMEESRTAFIEAATAAGVGEEQAKALADQMGLIPTAAEIIFRTNATGVQAEMITLNERIKQIPPGKEIRVTELSAEARANLEQLGFKVEAIPGTKDVKVTAPTDEARAELDAFVAFANGTNIVMTGDMNVDPATNKITQTVVLGNGQTATMTYDANASAADGKIHATVDLGNGQTASLTYDATPDPATGQIKATVEYANGQKAELLLDPNDQVTPTLDQLLHPETIPVNIETGSNTAQPDKDKVTEPGQTTVDINTGTNQAQTDKDTVEQNGSTQVDINTGTNQAKTDKESVVNSPGKAHVDIETGSNTAEPDKKKVEEPGKTPIDLVPGTDTVTPKIGEITQPSSSTHTINVVNNATAAIQANSTATSSTHTINVTNNVPAAVSANQTATSSTHTINVTNNVPAAKEGNAGATSSTHTINVTNNVPAAKEANGGATSSMHTISVTDNVPAAKTAAQQPTESMHTLNCDDQQVLDKKRAAEQPTQSLHTINCNDDAVRDAKRRAEQGTSSTHTIFVKTVGGPPASGGGVFNFAGGGVSRGGTSKGMVVSGYQPGRDTVPAVISRGEAVLVPELVRMLGARRILAANAAASGGRAPTVVGQLAGLMDGTIGHRFSGGGVVRRFEDGTIVPKGYGTPNGINYVSGGSLGSVGLSVRRMAGGGVAGSTAARPMPRWSHTSGSSSRDSIARELRALAEELRARAGSDVTITNNFAIANASQAADEVARTQRVEAAQGIFG